jgi:hypothetical protein
MGIVVMNSVDVMLILLAAGSWCLLGMILFRALIGG